MVESQLYSFLERSGFQIPRYHHFRLDEEPSADFYPLALKIESPNVVHKSDVGGVVISIKDENDLRSAKEQILHSLAQHNIALDPGTDGFIATAMVRGEELFAGVVSDPIFGQTILFGKGGVLLELYRDVCYIDPKADEAEIRRALKTIKIGRLFEGFRGASDSTAQAVAFIQTLQRFVLSHPDILECDLNPVIFNAQGFTIVDARLRYRETPADTSVGERVRVDFFDNRSVAVIGASNHPGKVGYAIAKNALSFEGRLYLVNAGGGEFCGHPLYRDVSEIDDTIDTAVITIPSRHVLETIRSLVPKGVRNVIVVSAGFKEAGDTHSEEELTSLARTHNLNIIGPNCLGYFEASRKLNLTFGSSSVQSGDLALIAQSGAVLSSLMDKAVQSGIGFSHILSMGNMADADFADIITMLGRSETCRYISIYAEGIQNGSAFLEALRRSTKPVRVYKAGKTPQARKAAFSHTGNLSGDYPMFKALLESVGVQIVDTIEALLYHHSERFEHIAIITNAGGPGTILTDYVIERGAKLYELTSRDINLLDSVLPSNWSHNNPIDIIGDAQSDRFEATLRVIDEIEGIGMVYLLVTPQMMTDTPEIVKLLEKPWKKPLYPILLGGEMMEEAMEYLHSRSSLFFTTLQEASAFL